MIELMVLLKTAVSRLMVMARPGLIQTPNIRLIKSNPIEHIKQCHTAVYAKLVNRDRGYCATLCVYVGMHACMNAC